MVRKHTDIKSISEFKQRYFPKAYQKELLENAAPEEIGRKFAKDTINKVKKLLEKLF